MAFRNSTYVYYFGMDKYESDYYLLNETRGDNELSREPAGIDERYELLSTNLKVSIPAPEKYKGCDNDFDNFFSSYYPDQTQEAENKTKSILDSPIQGAHQLSRMTVEYLGLESYGFISSPDSLAQSPSVNTLAFEDLSVESLGLESYEFISSPDSLAQSPSVNALAFEDLSVESLGLEEYVFITDGDI